MHVHMDYSSYSTDSCDSGNYRFLRKVTFISKPSRILGKISIYHLQFIFSELDFHLILWRESKCQWNPCMSSIKASIVKKKKTKANNKQLVLQMSAMNQLWVESSRRLPSQQTHFSDWKISFKRSTKTQIFGNGTHSIETESIEWTHSKSIDLFFPKYFSSRYWQRCIVMKFVKYSPFISIWSDSPTARPGKQAEDKKDIIWASFFIV